MEEKVVKLASLFVDKLYGYYNYEVKFNSDVTFLFGSNGCGKTTILNITEAIITGCFYKLFDYEFEKITLVYFCDETETNTQSIKIQFLNTDLKVNFNNKEFIIEKMIEHNDTRRISERPTTMEIQRLYYEKYPELIEVKDTFNYVYLPLNLRAMISEDNQDELIFRRNIRMRPDYQDESFTEPTVRDLQMIQIENLIYNVFMKINTNISTINDKFRDQILKSFLDVDIQQKYDEFANEYNNSKSIDIINTKKSYIKILNDLKIISKHEEKQYDNFFQSLIKDIEEKNNQSEKSSLTVPTVLKLNEIAKIRKIISIAERMEKDKAIARKPIEVFLDTMNEFIGKGEDDKSISIDTNGRIYFTTKSNNKHISIQSLSSGEKQLITFFANMIFRVKSTEAGIFVVDEPELSLHLSWQKIFVEKSMQINKNIQLIFATHSPEFIGSHRDKMYKLEKKFRH